MQTSIVLNKNTKQHYIYKLLDPNTLEIRYIGRTTDYASRYAHHCNLKSTQLLRGDELKVEWIKNLAKLGLFPIMEIFETHSNKEEAVYREKYWIDYYKNKCSLLNASKYQGEYTPKKIRPVLMYDSEGNFLKEFASPREASIYIKGSTFPLWNVLNGVTRLYKKHHFRWKEVVILDKIEIPKPRNFVDYSILKIDQYNTGTITKYNSYKEAARLLNCNYRDILAVLLGKKDSYLGCLWRFEQEDDDKAFKNYYNKRKPSFKEKVVYKYDIDSLNLLKKFDSVLEAAIYVSGSRGTLASYARNTSYGYGYLWSYRELTIEEKKKLLLNRTYTNKGGKGIKIRLFDKRSNECKYEFSSISKCAQYFNMSNGKIQRIIEGREDINKINIFPYNIIVDAK